MGVGGGNLHLMAALGVAALGSVTHLDEYWSLQRRHEGDDGRWVDLAHYGSRGDATEALERVVEHRHAGRDQLRVEHVRRSA
jgi:hypothetical protein